MGGTSMLGSAEQEVLNECKASHGPINKTNGLSFLLIIQTAEIGYNIFSSRNRLPAFWRGYIVFWSGKYP